MHVVVALIIGAMTGGLLGGLDINATLAAFNKGLGGSENGKNRTLRPVWLAG